MAYYLLFCEKEAIISFNNNPANAFLLTTLLLLIGAIIVTFLASKAFCALTVNRIQELNRYLDATASGKPMKLKEDNYRDEMSELRNTIVDAYQKMTLSRGELENNCQQLVETNQKLESRYIQAYNLQLIQEEISRELDIDKLSKKTADIIMGLFGSKRCLIYMADDENEALIAKASSGSMGKDAPKKEISYNSKNIVARSWREKEIFTEKDAKPGELAELKKRNIHNILIVPLIGRQGGVGVVLLEHELAGGINSDSIKFARIVAQELSLSVENAYLYDKMRQMAIQDALTGVYNRLYLMTYMEEIFANNPKMVSVLIFDMDHFKSVNDKFGHLAGDMVLKTTANLVRKMLPAGIIARYGGEEFVIVLPEVGQEEAVKFGNSIRQLVGHNQFFISQEKAIKVTISVGVANYPLVSGSYEGLLQLADKALYEAKNSGRNKVCVAETDNSRVQNNKKAT
jgi:diguanylate cyclase (GGDEF)-like protein